MRVHIDFQRGALADADVVLAGESSWAEPVGEGLYRLDNLLFCTHKVGYNDIVRCADLGTAWDVREVVAIETGYPCWRGLAIPHAKDPSHIRGISGSLTREFGEDVAVEGGMGALMVQCEPPIAEQVKQHLDAHPRVAEYVLDPINLPTERS